MIPPEIGSALDGLDTRLRCLEMLHEAPNTPPLNEQVEQEVNQPNLEWNKKQWDKVTQLKAMVSHLSDKWAEHLKEDKEYRASKRKIKSKYD